MKKLASVLLCAPLLLIGAPQAGELSGEAELVVRWFPQDPLDPRQYGNDAILNLVPEYFHDWDDGSSRLVITPKVRVVQGDEGDARTTGDFQELYWRKSMEGVDLYIGARKIFWGVTESVHLVDVVNQTEQVEDIDAEDKLGQPMVQLAFLNDWGTVDLLVMPYFRERRFASTEGRLRTPLPVSNDALYESSDEEQHVDIALRWSHFIGDWDIGIAHFSGTNREPHFIPGLNASAEPVLVPYYAQMEQTSIDLQATKGSWLWKLEAISRDELDQRLTRVAGGFEYSFYGIADSDADLGVIVEYLFDDQGDAATTPFENDVFAGARLALNDVQSTELLAGFIIDADNDAKVFSIEASRRIGSSWKLSLTGRIFTDVEPTDLLYATRNEDFVAVSLSKYF